MKTLLKIVGILLALILVAFGGLIVFAKFFYKPNVEVVGYYSDELILEKEAFVEEFEEIHQMTLDNYSLYKSKGIDMNALHNKFLKKIETEASNAVEFGAILKEYFAALNAGHATVLLNDFCAYSGALFIEGRIFIDRPNKNLRDSGFEEKDEIIEINGKAIAEWLDEHKKFTPASTDEARRMTSAANIFYSWADTTATYTVRRGDDTLTLNALLHKSSFFQTNSKFELVPWKKLSENVGYINLLTMSDPVLEEFDKAYQQQKELPNLIIDIRQNGGGNSDNGLKICEYLINKPQPHCLYHKLEMQPRADAFKGKIFILTSPFTFSAAESFAIDMKESGNATLVGLPTAGDTGNGPRIFRTSLGICFRLPTRQPALSPQGFPLEGKGVEPDIRVAQSVSDFLSGKDTALETVLSMFTE